MEASIKNMVERLDDQAARELRMSKKASDHATRLDSVSKNLDTLLTTSNQTSIKLGILDVSTTHALTDIRDDVKKAKDDLLGAIHALGAGLEQLGVAKKGEKSSKTKKQTTNKQTTQ